MRVSSADADGSVTVSLEPVEAALLTQLSARVAAVLTEEGADDAQPSSARARLLPDAYPSDAEASAEFRRFTAKDLTDRKVRNAQTVIVDVADALVADGPSTVRLSPQAIQAWLRALTDIRLVLATRLGIVSDGDAGDADDEAFMLADVYAWLGAVQESLVSELAD